MNSDKEQISPNRAASKKRIATGLAAPLPGRPSKRGNLFRMYRRFFRPEIVERTGVHDLAVFFQKGAKLVRGQLVTGCAFRQAQGCADAADWPLMILRGCKDCACRSWFTNDATAENRRREALRWLRRLSSRPCAWRGRRPGRHLRGCPVRRAFRNRLPH